MLNPPIVGKFIHEWLNMAVCGSCVWATCLDHMSRKLQGPIARTVVEGRCMVGSCHKHMLLHFQGSPCGINLYLEDVLLAKHDHNSI